MEKNSRKYIVLAILSVSFLQTMTTSIVSPTLGKMAEEFTSVGMSTIQLSMTISSICTIVMSVTIGKLMKRFSVKNLMTTGLILFIIGGAGGYFSGSIYQLLGLRIILGIGLGIFSPLLPIAVSQQFEGITRSKMMGYVQSANFLGGIVGTVLAGIIAQQGWRNVHLLYGVAVVSLLFTVLCYPGASGKGMASERRNTAVPKGKLPLLSFGLGLCMMLHALVFFKAPLTLAMFFPSIGLNNTAYAGIASGVLYAFSFLTGLIFVPLTKRLKHSVFVTPFVLMAAAYFLLCQASGAAMVYMASGLLGIGSGIFMPSLFAKVPEVIPGPHIAQTMVIVNCGFFIGVFLSPYFSLLVKRLGENTYTFDYMIGAGIEILFAAVALALTVTSKKRNETITS